MKYTVTSDFGHAKAGESILNGRVVGCGLFVQGSLKTKRGLWQFVIPRENVHVAPIPMTTREIAYHAKRTDPDTAHIEMARLEAIATQRELIIIRALEQRGTNGLTSKEAAYYTGIPHVSTSTSMTKMVRRGLIADSESRRSGGIVRVALAYSPTTSQGQGQITTSCQG